MNKKKKKTKQNKKPIFNRFIRWFVKYINDTWKVKIISLLFGGFIVYMAKTTPDLNILEEFGYFCMVIGTILIFIFVKNDIYKAFIGEP